MKILYLTLLAVCFFPTSGKAQLSSNKDKFLGNITTGYQVDYGKESFHSLWNQITPENETKWSSIEGSARGQFNWGGADKCADYAKKYGFPFKFHTLIWGGQYPNWMNNLSTKEQYKAIIEWFDAVKKHYPNLEIIDVVNEALPGHNPAPFKAALGGDGKTGWDWIIKAFELAHERWPDAILVYNDFNTFQWNTDQFIELVRIIRDAGAPIDAYGCQSHDLTDCNFETFKSSMDRIQNTLKMPMYSTEYDIGTYDDKLQEQRYMEQIPYMWEADYCAGITLWGYIYGHTWTTNGNSGIIRDGVDRPAMEWLRKYMKTAAARNAKSPFPGMKKEASVYVKPQSLSVTKGEPMNITINARLRTKTIDHIDFYVKGVRYTTLTEAPYVVEYTPNALGKYSLRAVVVATDGSKYERLSSFTAYNPRSPYKGEIALPGTIQVENFDVGGDGVTFHDSDGNNQGTSYRTNGGGVDIVTGNGGYAIGYTATGEWLEYTVDVKDAGYYSYDAWVSSGVSGSSVQLTMDTGDAVKDLTEVIVVPQTGSSNWDKYVAIHGRTLVSLKEGKQIIRLNITGGNCNVDKFVFKHLDLNEDIKLTLKADPAPATINEYTTLIATPSTDNIKSVSFYVENKLVKTVTEAPFEAKYRPTAKGTYNVTAEATDTDGKTSKVFKYSLNVNNKRTPYKGIAAVPGVIQVENFDKGGEGFTFHDSDSKDEGDAKYRTDNEGVDLVKGNGGTVVGYTAAGEWMEYSINVTESGKYEFEATVSSGTTGGRIRLGLVKDGKVITLGQVNVPQTGSNWDTYKVVKGRIARELEVGQQILRLTIVGSNFNVDQIELICTEPTTGIDIVDQTPQLPASDAIYNLAGQRVDAKYKGIVIKNGKKSLNR
ncbi:MAG: endo-1,4-beta-xylanase [Bacteroidaceae bacterium]|nr:endo-1,4-beta-xylanase [Bacteroidaceae bacterium]